jgi:hypothetical protein
MTPCMIINPLGRPNSNTGLFLSLPAEVRNQIYNYLLPEYGNPRSVLGFLASCPQIHEELGNLLVKSADRVVDEVFEGRFMVLQADVF